MLLAISLLTFFLDLSAAAYDVDTLDTSPPDSSITAAIKADCCVGVTFIRVAMETSLGDSRMLL